MATNVFDSVPTDSDVATAPAPLKNIFDSLPGDEQPGAASSLVQPKQPTDLPNGLTTEDYGRNPLSLLVHHPGMVLGGALKTGGDLARGAVTDAVDTLTGFPKSGGNLLKATQNNPFDTTQDQELPADKVIDSIAKTNPKTAIIANVAQGAAGAAPLAVMGGLPSILQKAAALGFSAQMISGVKDTATQLGTEMGKPAAQQDAAKIARLKSDLIQTGVFAPLAAAGGAGKFVSDRLKPSTTGEPNASQIKKAVAVPGDQPPVNPKAVAEGSAPNIQAPAQEKVITHPNETENQTPVTQGVDQTLPKPVGQGTPPSSQAEATSENQPVLQPALKWHDQIFAGGGNKHVQIALEHSNEHPDLMLDYADDHEKMSGFVDQNGKFYTRAEAAKTGVFGDKAPQSENLPSFDENGAPPPKKVTPVESAKPVSDFDRYQQLTSSLKGKTMDEAQPILKEVEAIKNRNGGNPPPAPQSQGNGLPSTENTKNAPEPLKQPAVPVQSGGDRGVTGLAARVREQRETAGQTDPTQPGKGIAPEASVERGRQLVQSGADPESVMQQFEKTNRVSSDDFAVARANTESLTRATNEAEDKFGRGSKEWDAAYKTESDWAARTKAMQTEWAKSGHAQQGEVDIDTSSFSGLKRAYRDSHNGEELPAKDEKKAQALADENKKLAAEKADLMKRLSAAIENETAPKIEPHVRIIADKLKGFFENSAKSALDRIKARRAEGRLFAGIDPTELADYAAYGASKILSKGIEGAEMSADWAKEMTQEIGDYITPHLKQIWDASKKALDVQFRKVAGVGATAKKVKDAVAATVEKPAISAADQKALDAANKTVREAAARLAKAETDANVLQSGKNKTASKQQVDNAKKAVEAANKTVREAAARAAELENKKRIAEAAKKQVPGTIEHTRTEFFRYKGGEMDGDQVRSLWNYAKKNYIDKGNDDFTDIVNKVSTDLGLSFKDVANGLSQPKTARKITDELWRKQTDARRVSENAKRWVRSQNTPILGQTVPRIARLMFGLKVAGHGGVAFGTHAPMVAFMPKYTKTYLRDFGKMYKMVFSTAEYEKNVQALRADPNYTVAQRAGLVNDPYKVEDFNNPDMAQILGNTGKLLGKIAGGGNRGYFALKVLRQDMFNQSWNKLPETIKTPEMAKAMADDINHITGVVKGSGSNKASLALFAPRLLMSRAAFLVGDPYKAIEITSTAMSPAKWKALPPEQKFQVINQVKQKATILAVAYGLLKANQAILSATGSNQKINTTDPTKSDFMKFKIAGMDFSYGNAMLNMARLPVRLWTIGSGDGGKLKKVIYPDESMYSAAGEFARSQASPAASMALDFVFKGDYQNRPLPQIPGYGKPIPMPKRLAAQGIKPYTWTEYFAEQFAPIPLEEAQKEVWRHGFGHSPEQLKSYAKAFGTLIVMAGTGGRLSDDIQPKSTQPASRFKQ